MHYAGSPQAAPGHRELAHDGAGHADRKPIRLSPRDIEDLAAFLRSLTGPIADPAAR